MKARIWRYQHKMLPTFSLEMPSGALVLSCAGARSDAGSVEMWVSVEPEKPLVRREFCLVATGDEIPPQSVRFIGTLFRFGGSEVYHLFEFPQVYPVMRFPGY